MKRIEKLSEDWLRANDWDYRKYGDRRQDRSAYDTMMNYEISDELASAFQAGFRAAREMTAKEVGDHADECIEAPPWISEAIRQLGEEEIPDGA